MRNDAEVIGGKEIKKNGEIIGSLSYKFDFSKKPIHLDFIFSFIDPEKKGNTMKMIVKFIDKDTMVIHGNSPTEERATEFSEKNAVTFERV